MTLLELLGLLKKKWYFMVLFPLLFAGGAAAYCWGYMADTYTASTSLYVLTKYENADGTPAANSVNSSTMAASQQLANDIAVLAETERVESATAKALNMSSLKGYKTSVSSDDNNRIITLNVTGPDAQSVAKVADELAEQVSEVAIEIMDLEAVNIVDDASVPLKPSGPDRVKYTLIAFLAGLFFAVALIVVLDLLDTTIRNPEDAEDVLGIPVLGRMPAPKGKGE